MTPIDDAEECGFKEFLAYPQEHNDSVRKLRVIAANACSNIPTEFGYTIPSGRQLTSSQLDATRSIQGGVEPSPDVIVDAKIGRAWELGAIAPRMRVFPDLRLHAIGDLLKCAADEFEKGYLRASFALVRSALEITAYLPCLEDELDCFRSRLEGVPLEIIVADKLLNEIDEILHRHIFGTKLDLAALQAKGLVASAEIVTGKSDELVDLRPDRLTNVFESLKSRVSDAWKLYQFVCDFAHPNAFLHFEYVAEELQSKHGNLTVSQRRYDVHARSAGLINTFRPAIRDALDIYGRCLSTALVSRSKIVEVAELVTPVARNQVHRIIFTEPAAFPRNMPCPCQSTLLVGQCCGFENVKVH